MITWPPFESDIAGMYVDLAESALPDPTRLPWQAQRRDSYFLRFGESSEASFAINEIEFMNFHLVAFVCEINPATDLV
jgi:hypothetical protein